MEKSKCSNLIKNPIVLILALVIFDIEKNLPNRRVEFYKKCIDTFLVVREDRKAAFQMTEKFKNILGDDLVVPQIAHYKFEHVNEDARYKFTGEEVKKAIMEAIEVPDKINWREPVNQYTSYLVNRTELLSEVDEDKFDFAHKTFYEYFLALYFSKELDNVELVSLLRTWIGDSNNDELARLIIEVVIEKNEPRQHKYIIDFMFQQIEEECEKTRDEDSKEVDIFVIIADLYKNSMLLPKFHEKYYKCLIYHSQIVGRAERKVKRFGNSSTPRIEYDANILTQYFIEEIKDSQNFNKVISAMYKLNNDFKRKVVQETGDDVFQHISQLFSWIQRNSIDEREKDNGENIEKELRYFLGNQLNLTLSCPQIYISIVDIIVLKSKNELIPLLLGCKFEAHNVFYSYTSPRILYLLTDLVFKSEEGFLLFLILIIRCAKTDTNHLLGYVLHSYRRITAKEGETINRKKNCQNVILFWKLLNYSENVEQFKEKISELLVYNEKYDDFYEKLFIEYKSREQNICRDRVIEGIERFEKFGGDEKDN